MVRALLQRSVGGVACTAGSWSPPISPRHRSLPCARVSPWRAGWVPATALAAVVAVVVGMTVMRSAAPPQTATRRTTVSQFAADVSDAVFASAADSEEFAMAADAPDLGAALDAGWPCSREQFLEGECNDDVSVLLFASD